MNAPVSNWAWLAVAVGIALRVYQFALNQSLWLDEVMLSLNITDRTFVQLLEPLTHKQAAPPAFLWVERLAIASFGVSEFALRLFPLLSACASLVLFAVLCRRYLPATAAIVAVTVFATGDGLIYFSSEVKQYSTDVLCSVALMLLAMRVLDCEKGPTRRERMRSSLDHLAIGGAIAVWFSHGSVFILTAIGAMLAIMSIRDRRRLPMKSMLVIPAAWLSSFGVLYFVSLDAILGESYFQDYFQHDFAPIPPTSLADLQWFMSKGAAVLSTAAGSLSLWLAIPLCLLGMVHNIRRRDSRVVLQVVPFLSFFLASSFGLYPAHGRLFLFLAPCVLMLLGDGLGALLRPDSSRRVKAIGCAAGGLLLVLSGLCGVSSMKGQPPRQQVRQLLASVNKEREPDDLIYVHHRLRFHYEFYATRLGLEPDRVVVGRVMIGNDTRTLESDLKALPASDRVWFVSSDIREIENEVVDRVLRRSRPSVLTLKTFGTTSVLFGPVAGVHAP